MRQSGSKSILGEQMREFFAAGWEEVIRSIDSSEWLLLGTTILAALIGGLLGWEREALGKDAGLRTHILVCIASALVAGIRGLPIGLDRPAVAESNRSFVGDSSSKCYRRGQRNRRCGTREWVRADERSRLPTEKETVDWKGN